MATAWRSTASGPRSPWLWNQVLAPMNEMKRPPVSLIVAASPPPVRGALGGSAASAYYRPVSIDPVWLFLSMIPSGIGFVLFVYGKKQDRGIYMLAGIVFAIYPYFTPSSLVMMAIGVALGIALWLAVRAGW
jgi:hypothetical protein